MHVGKGSAGNMVQRGSALLEDAMKVLLLMVSAQNMVATGSALGNGATRPLILEEGVASTCTPRKSARWMVVILLLLNVAFAVSMVRMGRASLMAAPPTQLLDLNIAPTTVGERRRSRALCGMHS